MRNFIIYKATGTYNCLFIFLLWGLSLLLIPCYATQVINQAQLSIYEKQHGEMAKRRLIAWQKLIKKNKHATISKKLSIVNDFFNQLRYRSDISFVGKTDYWMTPVEFLIKAGGDCEDFSIAKYFTLLALDIPINKLRITYVKSLTLNQAHMVLAYYENNNAEPLILDNLMSKIKKASQRKDLKPVYSFNGKSLWLNKLRGQSSRIGSSDNLSKWQSMLKRMKNVGE